MIDLGRIGKTLEKLGLRLEHAAKPRKKVRAGKKKGKKRR